jgi:hypothetical protein
MHKSVVNNCYDVLEDDDNTGLVQILTYNMPLTNYADSLKTFDGTINKPTSYFLRDDGVMTGWFMVGRKDEWRDIDSELHYFFGDNFIYLTAEINKRKIVKICSKFISHLTSTTVKELGLYQQGVLEKELEIFKQKWSKFFPGVVIPNYSIPVEYQKNK